MASSTSGFPHSTPMPMGPPSLCAEKAMRSQSRSFTSTAMWGTDCAPSTTMYAPTSCARCAMALTSFWTPRTLETCVTDTILVCGPILAATSSGVIR